MLALDVSVEVLLPLNEGKLREVIRASAKNPSRSNPSRSTFLQEHERGK